MLQNRLTNGLSSGRKQQTAVKQTVDRPRNKSWLNEYLHQRSYPYPSSSLIHNHQVINEENHWLKSSTKTFDDLPQLELTCQEEMLTEAQLQTYPAQVNIDRISLDEMWFYSSSGI